MHKYHRIFRRMKRAERETGAFGVLQPCISDGDAEARHFPLVLSSHLAVNKTSDLQGGVAWILLKTE